MVCKVTISQRFTVSPLLTLNKTIETDFSLRLSEIEIISIKSTVNKSVILWSNQLLHKNNFIISDKGGVAAGFFA